MPVPIRSPPAWSSVETRARVRRATIGVGQRMLAALVDAGREAQHLVLGVARRRRRRASKAGLPSVSVPVLSTISVSTLRRFSIAAASRNSTPCVAALAGRDHDRHRRREAERARARDDQHGHGVDERRRPSSAPGRSRPQAKNVSSGDRDHADDEPAGDPVGHALHRRPACAAPARPSARSARARSATPTVSARMTRRRSC